MEQEMERLKKVIASRVFVKNTEEPIVNPLGIASSWIFDFRRAFLDAQVLSDISALFWKKYADQEKFQIGGVEAAAIPLITALIIGARQYGSEPNGFFIRKSRKKTGLLRLIEGQLTNDRVVLVDDLINSGDSLRRQIEILKDEGKRVTDIFVILRFRDVANYTYFADKDISIHALFSLHDFSDLVPLQSPPTSAAVPHAFKAKWRFKSEGANYFYVGPKSAPAIDADNIYFGSDSGYFWAIKQSDGSVVWKFKVGFHARGKYIFSSPVVYENSVFFGAYDGNFYSLDSQTGRKRWIFMEADWIGSSPCLAIDLSLIFVGLEFGLWKKRGGIAALNIRTGDKVWEHSMPEYTHSTPAYSAKNSIVLCGCNDSAAYAFDARSGSFLWKYQTGGEIKQSFALDESRGLVAFGSFDKCVYVLKITSGELVHKIETREAIYSTPLIFENKLFVASLDKRLYCIDIDTGHIRWHFETGGRIFASPEIFQSKLYIGSNDGKLYELDPESGANTARFQATERITNKIAFNTRTGKIFLPTFANEIYCLARPDSLGQHERVHE